MFVGRMLRLLTIIQLASGSLESFQGNSFLVKLVNSSLPGGPGGPAVAGRQRAFGCEDRSVTVADSVADSVAGFLGRSGPRIGREEKNSSAESDEMEPLAAKFTLLNLLSDEDEEEEESDDNEDDEKVKHEEEEDDEDIDFFGPDEETGSNEVEGTKEESFLKQYHRQGLRMHNLVFPLLLAYKLKFFTVIPLLLGALVLLVGTTGVAGFFFALFAAALGIHVKSNHE